MLEYALNAIKNGFSAIPSDIFTKTPTCNGGSWKKYQSEIADEKTIKKWFSSDVSAFSIVTGSVSGNLELLDFDYEAELFPAWADLVKSELPGLFEKLLIETSQSSKGQPAHVIYRCESEISGNKPLAYAISYVSGNLQFCVNAYNTNIENTEKIDIQELAFWGLYSMFIKNNKITIAKAQNLLNEYWDKVNELEMEETE